MPPFNLPELTQSKSILKNAYGSRLKDIILFGSMAH